MIAEIKIVRVYYNRPWMFLLELLLELIDKKFRKIFMQNWQQFFFFFQKNVLITYIYVLHIPWFFFFFLHIFVLRAYYERVNIHFSYVRLSYLFCKIRYYLLNSRTNLLRVRMYTRYYTYYRVIVNQLDVINK